MKSKAIIFIIISIIALTAVAAWQSKSREILAGVRNIAEAELAVATGAKIEFSGLEVASLSTIYVYDVNIYDREDKLIAASPKLTLRYSPVSALLGQKSNIIKTIEAESPFLTLVQNQGGRWNFEDLITKKEAVSPVFTGKIILNDGQAEILSPAGHWRLTAVSGSFDLENNPSTGINLSAIYNQTPLEVSGTLDTGGDGILGIKARRLSIADLTPLLPNDNSVRIDDGILPVVDVTVKKLDGEIKFAGQAEFSNIEGIFDSVPVADANGFVIFSDERIYISAAAKAWDQPMTVRGKIALNTGSPMLNLKVSSAGFDPAAVKADLPVGGLISFDAAVTGQADDVEVSGSFKIADGEIQGIALKNIEAQAYFAQNKLTVSRLKGDLAGGRIDGAGTLNISDGSYNFHIAAKRLDSTAFGQYLSGLSGLIDADIAAYGFSAKSDEANIAGTVNITDGSYQGFNFSKAEGSFYLAGNNLTLDYINIGVEGGVITARGAAGHDSLLLNIQGNGIPLKILSTMQSELNLTGTADFSGIVSGTPADPSASLEFCAVDGEAFYQPFSQARGHIEIDKENAILKDIVLTHGPATHTVSGNIGLGNAGQVNLHIISRQARAENFVRLLAPGEQLTGNIDNDITLTGPLDNLNIQGKINITDGSFRGQLITAAKGSYNRENGIARINDFLINFLNSTVKISGVINKGQEMDLTIDSQNFEVGKLRLNLPYALTGKANFKGRLTGTPQQPFFSGDLTAGSLIFKDRELTDVSGEIKVAGNDVEIPQFKFRQGGGNYNFAGGLDLESKLVYGGLEVEDGDLAALLSILDIPAEGVSGQMNGHIRISGTMTKPNVSLTGSVKNGKIKQYPLDSVDLDAAFENNVVTVNQFLARQGSGVLAVRGKADLNGALDFEAGGRDIDAGLITAIFNTNFNVSGKLNFAAQVSGTAQNPRADVSLEIAGGGVGASAFDSLYGLFILHDHSININQLFLTKGQYRASAYGTIPVAALSSEGRRQATAADQMDVKVRLDQADLSILPLLTDEVDWAVGKTQGQLNIGGTINQPYLTGSISVADGTVKLAKLHDPIQKVALDIQFKGDKIILNGFSGCMGSGSYLMTGSTSLLGAGLTDYNFELKLDKVGISSKYFKGPLTGNLSLTSQKGRPLLSGKLLFERDTIDIPFIADFTQSDFDVGLDIELVAGNKVRFYNSYMYDIWAEGRVKFAGTTKWPVPSGQITAIRGTVSYLRTQFRLKDGSAVFNQIGTFEPIIKLAASTRLHDTIVNLNLSGPASNMDLKLTAEPAMNQQEIISLLTLRSRYFEKKVGGNDGSSFGRDEVISFLDAGLQMRFVSEVENTLREALGLDDFQVVRDTLWYNSRQNGKEDGEGAVGREVYNIEMGKYVTDKLMLNYTMGIDNTQHSFGFRYDINKKISLTGLVDDQNEKRIGIETRFKF